MSITAPNNLARFVCSMIALALILVSSIANAQVSPAPTPSPTVTPSVTPSPSPTPTSTPVATASPTPTQTPGHAPVSVAPVHVNLTKPDNTVYLKNADLLRLGDNDVAHLTGHVEVQYRQYTLRSDTAFIDADNDIAQFAGHVSIVSADGQTSIVSDSPNSQINLDTHNAIYSVTGPAHAIVAPSNLEGSGLIQPLLVDSNGFTVNDGILDARQSGFTTCDFLSPHYYFSVQEVKIYPGKRLIARHAILYRRHARVAEIPYLAIPLNDRYARANYLPTVGQDPSEGYYAKFAVPYVLSDAALGILRLDLMQLKGIGTGFDQSYQAHGPGGGGTLSVYQLDDKSTGLEVLTESLTHHQSIGSFQLGVNSQFQNNSYLSAAGSSQSTTNQITLTSSTATSQTNIAGNFQQSNYGSGPDSNVSASLNEQDKLDKRDTADFKLNFAGFSTPGAIATPGQANASSDVQQSLASTLALHLQPNGLHVDIESDLFTTLQNTTGSSLASSAGLLREPEIMLSTTGTGNDPLDELAKIVHGSQIQTGFGLYDEPSSGANTSRYYWSYNEGSHTDKHGPLILTSQASYTQSFYGDGGAQYTLNGHYGSEFKEGPVDFSAVYSTLRVYGYTPFLFDRSGETNSASFNATMHPSKALDFTASTAYDFLHDQSVDGLPAAPWANLLGALDYHPSQYLVNKLQATYDPNHGQLFDVTNDLQINDSAGLNFHTSVDYLPEDHKVGTVNSTLDLPIVIDKREDAGYRIQAIAGYNGFDDQFTYEGLSLTRSWHDWELTGTYQYSPTGVTEGSTFSFTFHLKALPGFQPFGIGGQGQELGGGVGQVL